MRLLIVITVIACGILHCDSAPAPTQSVVAVPAQQIQLEEMKNIQFNVGRVLDASLGKITLADCMAYLSDSLNKNVKPLVDGWGKFNLRSLIVDWNRRNQALVHSVKHKGEELIEDVHSKGHAIIKGVKDKKEEIVSAVQDKGEELFSKKKQVLSEIHNKGEHIIDEVLEGAKKKIAVLKPEPEIVHHQKPYYRDAAEETSQLSDSEMARRKRETEELAEGVADAVKTFEQDPALNEIDTKMADEVDSHDVYPSYISPSSGNGYYKKPAVISTKPEPEYYTVNELGSMFVRWIRHNLSLRRLLRRPSVTSA